MSPWVGVLCSVAIDSMDVARFGSLMGARNQGAFQTDSQATEKIDFLKYCTEMSRERSGLAATGFSSRSSIASGATDQRERPAERPRVGWAVAGRDLTP